MSEVLELEHLFRVSARDRHETVVPHERGEPALRAFLIDQTEKLALRDGIGREREPVGEVELFGVLLAELRDEKRSASELAGERGDLGLIGLDLSLTMRAIRLSSTAALISLETGSASIARTRTATMKNVRPTEGMMPRVRSMRLSELLRSAATIGRTAAYPVAAKSISTTAMIPTKAIVVSSCLGSRTKTSSAFATGPSKAIAAAAARIHEARL